MKKKVIIGDGIKLDVSRLIETRLLVQANSGGGKSWLLRRLLEQTHGSVQQIIIDMEGEFSTLREKYDYILASDDDGDVPISVKSAKLFAKKLLELNVSAIIDLYELKPRERLSYVRLFIDGLINAPKRLWHPAIIVIDEANHLCPQKGQAESAESIISLCQRGRKRGFCAVLATQRISMLDKNAAAECNNKLIGRTGLDVDRKRASEELGFVTKEQVISLRSLKAGEFFAFGPAISTEVIKLKVGGVTTTHPKAGRRIATGSTPPTTKIKNILHKLVDLPQEAAKELKTLQDRDDEIKQLRLEIKNLNREIKRLSSDDGEKVLKAIYKKDLNNVKLGHKKEIDAFQKKVDDRFSFIHAMFEHVLKAYENIDIEPLRGALSRLEQELDKEETPRFIAIGPGDPPKLNKMKEWPEPEYGREIKQEFRPRQMGRTKQQNEDFKLVAGAFRMLKNLAIHSDKTLTREQLAILSDIKLTGGTFSTYIGSLRSMGFIEGDYNALRITEDGIDYIGEPPDPMSVEEMQNIWRNKLVAGAQRMFDNLLSAHPEGLTREELAELSDIKLTGGTFSTYIGKLRTAKIAELRDGRYFATDTIVNGV